MSLFCKSGAFNISTGAVGTTQNVTLGWFPEVIVFQIVGNTNTGDSGPDAGDIVRSVGMCMKTGSTVKRCCISGFSQHNVSPSNAEVGHRNDAIVGVISSGSWNGLLDIDNQDGTSFRVIIDQQFTNAYRLMWWAFGGYDILALDLIEVTEPVSAGEIDVVAGFNVDAVICLTQDKGDTSPQLGSNLGLSMGVAARRPLDTIEQGLIATSSRDNVNPADVEQYQIYNQLAGLIDYSAGTIKARMRISAWKPTGFTLDFLETSGSGNRVYYLLLIQGGRWAVKPFQSKNDTITNTDVEDMLFTPIGGLYLSNVTPNCADDTVSTVMFGRFGVGMLGSDLTQGVMNYRDQNGAATTVGRTSQSHDNIMTNSDASIIRAAMKATSFLTDGIRHINTTAGIQDGHVLSLGEGAGFSGLFSDDRLFKKIFKRGFNRLFKD